jgi:ferredoxin
MHQVLFICEALCQRCGACWAECPRGAIQRLEEAGQARYRVEPDRCDLCRGHPAGPRCRAACPQLGCLVERTVGAPTRGTPP